jgi:hypothetical protein
MFVLPEEEKSHLRKKDFDGLTDALTQSESIFRSTPRVISSLTASSPDSSWLEFSQHNSISSGGRSRVSHPESKRLIDRQPMTDNTCDCQSLSQSSSPLALEPDSCRLSRLKRRSQGIRFDSR